MFRESLFVVLLSVTSWGTVQGDPCAVEVKDRTTERILLAVEFKKLDCDKSLTIPSSAENIARVTYFPPSSVHGPSRVTYHDWPVAFWDNLRRTPEAQLVKDGPSLAHLWMDFKSTEDAFLWSRNILKIKCTLKYYSIDSMYDERERNWFLIVDLNIACSRLSEVMAKDFLEKMRFTTGMTILKNGGDQLVRHLFRHNYEIESVWRGLELCQFSQRQVNGDVIEYDTVAVPPYVGELLSKQPALPSNGNLNIKEPVDGVPELLNKHWHRNLRREGKFQVLFRIDYYNKRGGQPFRLAGLMEYGDKHLPQEVEFQVTWGLTGALKEILDQTPLKFEFGRYNVRADQLPEGAPKRYVQEGGKREYPSMLIMTDEEKKEFWFAKLKSLLEEGHTPFRASVVSDVVDIELIHLEDHFGAVQWVLSLFRYRDRPDGAYEQKSSNSHSRRGRSLTPDDQRSNRSRSRSRDKRSRSGSRSRDRFSSLSASSSSEDSQGV